MELPPVSQFTNSSISPSLRHSSEPLSPVLTEIYTIPDTTQIATGMLSRCLTFGFRCLLTQRPHPIDSSGSSSILSISMAQSAAANSEDGESVVSAESKFEPTNEPASIIITTI